MVFLGSSLLRGVKKTPTYLPNPLAAAGLVRGPAAVRDIVPRTILNNKSALSLSLSLSLSPPSSLSFSPLFSLSLSLSPPSSLSFSPLFSLSLSLYYKNIGATPTSSRMEDDLQ